ncbi:hypothetical protein FACS189454_09920 [Planctomycetales bacterium]|nr:hypothetical protein FACS189454_09920 [Planctomycetales bacterium]
MRRAFTLIEVLIVLALMTVILLLISLAIDIFMRQMSINRTEIEEARLARSILETIAYDIRNAIQQTQDESQTSATSEDTESTESDLLTEDTTSLYSTPGIYGDLDWIQIDTAKLPRGETFGARQVRNTGSRQPDRLSASKTVLYYFAAEGDSRYNVAEKGLYRRQFDRQATQYAINEGTDTELEEYDEPLAPEVSAITFEYFDPAVKQSGTTGTWYETWDMDEYQTLPAAVQITISILRGESEIVYSLVVPIALSASAPASTTSDTDSSGSTNNE